MLPGPSIFEEFRDVAITSGSETLIPVSHGNSFVEACDARDLAILGIEGFEKHKDGIMPRTDLIADFSGGEDEMWDSFRKKCSLASRKFISAAQKEGEVYLSFVLEEPPA